jgi:hypothetical protein
MQQRLARAEQMVDVLEKKRLSLLAAYRAEAFGPEHAAQFADEPPLGYSYLERQAEGPPEPEMQAPEMQAPEMQAPEMQEPEMQAPEVQAPEMQAPEVPEVPQQVPLPPVTPEMNASMERLRARLSSLPPGSPERAALLGQLARGRVNEIA